MLPGGAPVSPSVFPSPSPSSGAVQEGSAIEIVSRGDQVVLSKKSYDLTEMLAQVTVDNIHAEQDTGPCPRQRTVVGREYIPARGDVVWLSFTPQAGHEQAGHRPALVLSPKAYNEKTSLALLCPITSRVKGYPFEVILPSYQLGNGGSVSGPSQRAWIGVQDGHASGVQQHHRWLARF